MTDKDDDRGSTGSDALSCGYPVRVGFVPLIDCAIPVVAHEKGFAAAQGLSLSLVREMSWAAIRDKLSFGLLDVAHLLAGIPLANAAGVGSGAQVPMIAPMALGRGGNAITVSMALYQRMVEADPQAMQGNRSHAAQALRKVIEADREAGRPPLSFGTVFPVSSHTFELRYWLAAGGIDPDRDVTLGVVAPPRMVESLRDGYIDGYCVGEPWNLHAVEQGLGVIVATKDDIWPAAPEKVLGIRQHWADENPAIVQAVIRSFVEAARWADAPENRQELAALLAQDGYLAAPEALLYAALKGEILLSPGGDVQSMPDRHVFFRWQSTFPWRSHGLWLMAQMRRWRMLPATLDPQSVEKMVQSVYRPDLYREAVASLHLPVPAIDSRVEGGHSQPFRVPASGGGEVELGPDAFMDGVMFDPSKV